MEMLGKSEIFSQVKYQFVLDGSGALFLLKEQWAPPLSTRAYMKASYILHKRTLCYLSELTF